MRHKNYLLLFTHVLGLMETLQPHIYRRDYPALADIIDSYFLLIGVGQIYTDLFDGLNICKKWCSFWGILEVPILFFEYCKLLILLFSFFFNKFIQGHMHITIWKFSKTLIWESWTYRLMVEGNNWVQSSINTSSSCISTLLMSLSSPQSSCRNMSTYSGNPSYGSFIILHIDLFMKSLRTYVVKPV